MASAKENADFTSDMLPEYPLDHAIEWIQEHMDPEEVFSDDTLEDWAKNYGGDHLAPDEVFTDAALEAWATLHGWVKSDGPQ